MTTSHAAIKLNAVQLCLDFDHLSLKVGWHVAAGKLL